MTDFLAIQTQTGWGQVLETFAAWCQPQPGWRTLDVGCGPGLLPALLARRGCRACGVDVDAEMLLPQPLLPHVAVADVFHLPFPARSFDLVTASNLLFLLPDPLHALLEMARLLPPGGQVVLLNPSERMSVAAATALADRRGLQGVARASLITWATRAEASSHWWEVDLATLFAAAGLQMSETTLKVGPGLARFARGVHVEGFHAD